MALATVEKSTTSIEVEVVSLELLPGKSVGKCSLLIPYT